MKYLRPAIIALLALAAIAILAALLFTRSTAALPGDTTRVSVASDGSQGSDASYGAAISANGRYVAFESYASNLVANDTNGSSDVFVYDRQTGQTSRVSVDSAGTQGNSGSYYPSVSADGRYVAFWSAATNLVPGDSNGFRDVFVHDMQTSQTTRVSVDSSGNQGLSGHSDYAAISADGTHVAFHSRATNLVAGDSNDSRDVFVHDTQTGQTTRVSVDSSGAEANGDSSWWVYWAYAPAISADGRYVAFASVASNLVAGDTNNRSDIFAHDRQTGQTWRASVDSAGIQGNNDSEAPALSPDGRYVAFDSFSSNLVSGDLYGFRDVFVHDLLTAQTSRVSVDGAGNQGNGSSLSAAVSADGRYIAFFSAAYNLVAADTNAVTDIFIHDRQTGQTMRQSEDSAGNQAIGGHSNFAAITADGRYVAFESYASNLVSGDTNNTCDIFVHDLGDPDADTDGDGYSDATESFLGTDPLDACPDTPDPNDERGPGFGEPLSPWPPDFDDNRVINITDVFQVLPPYFGSATGDPDYSERRDLFPDGVINITDVFKVLPPVFGSACTP